MTALSAAVSVSVVSAPTKLTQLISLRRHLPTIHNIKFRFKLRENFNFDNKLVEKHGLRSKCWGNYYTFKFGNKKKPAYSFFPCSKYVNVTGCANFCEVQKTVLNFNRQFKTNVKLNHLIIDNISASGGFRLCKKEKLNNSEKSKKQKQKQKQKQKNVLNLSNVKKEIEKIDIENEVKLSLYPLHFPGLVFRFNQKNIPTCVLFASGKFTIIGAKSSNQVCKAYIKLFQFINNINICTNLA